MDKISVIVPVYKAEAFLHRCVDSILNQSYGNLELILVDDGSPDNCGAICDAYGAKDSRVHVIHQENAGCSAARNAGIVWALHNSDSQWISFVDSDDWVHRDILSILMSTAQKQNAQIAMCDCHWVSEVCADEAVDTWEESVLEPEQALVHHDEKCMPPWGKIIWKPLLEDLRFPVGLRYEDAYISHILTLSANRVAVCTAKLYYYYNNPESYTRVAWTEDRVIVADIHEMRMDYFLEHGYQEAYKKEQIIYMDRLTENLRCLMHLLEEGDVYRKNFDLLWRKHRAAFRKARQQGILRFRWDYIWFYIFASPRECVWKTMAAARKLYHKIKG